MLLDGLLAPSVLISAAGLLILGAINRYGRIVDRIHEIDTQMRVTKTQELDLLRVERDLFYVRARRAWLALALLYGSVICFVISSITLGLTHISAFVPFNPAAAAVLLAGMILMGIASAALFSEATIAFETTKLATKRTDLFLK